MHMFVPISEPCWHTFIFVSEHVLDVEQQQNIVFQSKQLEGALPDSQLRTLHMLYIYIYMFDKIHTTI